MLFRSDTTEQPGVIEDKILIYPNPAKNELNVMLSDTRIISYKIIDLQGRRLVDKQVSATSILTLNSLPFASGIYLIEVTSETGKKYVGKVCKINN